MAEIQQEPSLAALFEPEIPGFRFIQAGRDTMVTYYCRSGTLLSLALYHIVPPASLSTLPRDWNLPVSVEEVLAAIPPDRHADLDLLLRKGETYAAFSLPSRPQLETFAKGRVVVIGDAAHLMMPSHAQGATLAIEEAGSLGVFCEHATAEQVPHRMQQWNEFIGDHARTVQDLSNSIVDPEAYERAKTMSKKPVFPRDQMSYTPPIWDYFFANDLETAAREFLHPVPSQ
jgi:salicylate hydroxylase